MNDRGEVDVESAGSIVIRIGLVGGYPYERDLVTSWLHAAPSVQSVTGMVPSDPRRNGRPLVDVAVVIVDEGDEDPLVALRTATGLDEDGRVVAVLRTASARLIETLAVTGVAAMVSMASGPGALAHALDRVMLQGAWLDPALSPYILRKLGWVPDNDLGLTPREFAVAEHLPEGLSRCEIAHALGVSGETVKTHMSSIYAKLEVNDRAAAAGVIKGALERRDRDVPATPVPSPDGRTPQTTEPGR